MRRRRSRETQSAAASDLRCGLLLLILLRRCNGLFLLFCLIGPLLGLLILLLRSLGLLLLLALLLRDLCLRLLLLLLLLRDLCRRLLAIIIVTTAADQGQARRSDAGA